MNFSIFKIIFNDKNNVNLSVKTSDKDDTKYVLEVPKSAGDRVLDLIEKVVNDGFGNVLAGVGASKIVSNAHPNLNPLQRMGVVIATLGLGAGTMVGARNLADAATRRDTLRDEIRAYRIRSMSSGSEDSSNVNVMARNSSSSMFDNTVSPDYNDSNSSVHSPNESINSNSYVHSPNENTDSNSSVHSPSESIDSNPSVLSSSHESTTSPDISFIDSPFEGEDFNPIIEVLKNLLFLDGIEGLYILLLILIICYKYLYKSNIKLLNKLVLLIPNKYLPIKFKNGISNVDKAVEFNSKFYDTMFIIVLILLLYTKLIHFYYSSELYSNIDDYILVYNYIKKSSLFIFVLPLYNNNYFRWLRREGKRSTTNSNNPPLLISCDGTPIALGSGRE